MKNAVTCSHCGNVGHQKSECRKLLASQGKGSHGSSAIQEQLETLTEQCQMLSDGLHETTIDAVSMDAVSINAVDVGAVAREDPNDWGPIANIRLRYGKLTAAAGELQKVVDQVSEKRKIGEKVV